MTENTERSIDREAFALMVDGLSVAAIARRLSVSRGVADRAWRREAQRRTAARIAEEAQQS